MDNNVFNDLDDPKDDVVAHLNAQAQMGMALGRGRVTGVIGAPVQYFKNYSSQSNAGIRWEVRLAMPLNRLRPYVTHSFLKSNDRSGPEIDVRVPRREQIAGIGTDVVLSTRTTLTLGVQRASWAFADDALFESVNLAQVLDRTGEGASLSFRYALTSLTRLALTAEHIRERFKYQPTRNSNTLRILPGVEFAPSALIRGRAAVGYRRFDISDTAFEDFSGVVALVDLSAAVRGRTLLAMTARRDVEYSFDPFQPYYGVQAFGGSVTQMVTERWRATAQAEKQKLTYRRTLLDSPSLRASRVDVFYTYGGGLHYRFRPDLQIGVTVDASRRFSGLESREYTGTRFFASFIYGS